jgi:hypothetical protein
VLFVVDVSDNASLAPATVELYELLQHVQLKVCGLCQQHANSSA